MVAVGLFLVTLLWLGWDGGTVGREVADGLHEGVRRRCLRRSLSCSIAVGGLMLVRSKIVDLKPFRTGLAVGAFGLMIALGRDEGGEIGGALGGGLAHVIGDTGALIVGVALFIAGTLLFTGASAGAVLRRSGTAVRRAGTAARRSLDGFDMSDRSLDEPEDDFSSDHRRPPVDAVASYPDVISAAPAAPEPPPLVMPDEDHGPMR